MATKKKTAEARSTIPVVKHKLITVRKLGTRTGREFEEDVREAMRAGYKVYAFGRTHDGVQIQMGKTEEWSAEDFLTEVRELLAEPR